MFKIYALLISLLFSYNLQAMENPVYDCSLKIDYVRSTTMQYDFTAYGELTCDDDGPMTIFSSVKVKDPSKLPESVKSFSVNIPSVKTDTISYLFQIYNFTSYGSKIFITFLEDGTFPSQILLGKLTSEFLTTDSSVSEFLTVLDGSEINIEQDEFFPDVD